MRESGEKAVLSVFQPDNPPHVDPTMGHIPEQVVRPKNRSGYFIIINVLFILWIDPYFPPETTYSVLAGWLCQLSFSPGSRVYATILTYSLFASIL